MVNLPPPNNDPNVPEGGQALAAPDGFAPQWIGEHEPNNNNGWIEWDVPLGREVDEPMVDLEFDEEEMDDDDDWDDDDDDDDVDPSTAAVEGPSASLPAPGLPVPPTVIEDLSTRLGNLEYRHGVLMRKMDEVSDDKVADSITIREIHPRVSTVKEQIQVDSRVDTYPSGQMAVPGQDELRTKMDEMESHEGILMLYMLWMEERLTVLKK
nr:hypothetical protein [Tanacetum cinerariifolium]